MAESRSQNSLSKIRSAFVLAVYDVTRRIPKGKVATYQNIAKAIGHPLAYRAVGNALHRNPTLITMPCHRVVASNGAVGEYAAGKAKKIALLRDEGVAVVRGKVDLKTFGVKKLL